jgi:hypothetical protein
MENFKEIAKKCLAGELSGVFIFNTGIKLHSQYLKKSGSKNYFYLRGFFIDKEGHLIIKGVEAGEIINFIPDNMQKKIEIDIPEGKVPIMEQTENGVVITWKEKELTYDGIIDELKNNSKYINTFVNNPNSRAFYKKTEVLRKLTNIRNYFGKPENMLEGWCIFEHNFSHKLYVDKVCRVSKFQVVFAEQEHAEQAIKMLGDELKYLFEPW